MPRRNLIPLLLLAVLVLLALVFAIIGILEEPTFATLGTHLVGLAGGALGVL